MNAARNKEVAQEDVNQICKTFWEKKSQLKVQHLVASGVFIAIQMEQPYSFGGGFVVGLQNVLLTWSVFSGR